MVIITESAHPVEFLLRGKLRLTSKFSKILGILLIRFKKMKCLYDYEVVEYIRTGMELQDSNQQHSRLFFSI